MKLVKYNPNALSLFDWDGILDRFFDDDINFNFNYPSVDIVEEKDKYVVKAELPGIDKKGIYVSTKDRDVLIKKVQPAGKKIMDAYAFHLGSQIKTGEYLQNGF